MLAALAHFPTGSCFPGPHVFGQTLAKSNCKGNSDNDGHDDIFAAGTVRLGGSSQAIREEHAETNVEISQHPRVAGQSIGQQDITKLAILGLGQATNGHALECEKEANAARPRGAVEGPDQNQEENYKDRLRDEVEAFDQFEGAVGSDPEDDEPKDEGNCEESGQAVGRNMMWSLCSGGARGVPNKRRNILIGRQVG